MFHTQDHSQCCKCQTIIDETLSALAEDVQWWEFTASVIPAGNPERELANKNRREAMRKLHSYLSWAV